MFTKLSRPIAKLLSALFLTTILPCLVHAQTTAARPDRGTMPNGSYAVSDFENISLANGNVNLTIPLASLPPIALDQRTPRIVGPL